MKEMGKNAEGDDAADRTIEQIPPSRFPQHVFIIPDGNVRWANKQNIHPSFGHIKGAEVLSDVLDCMQKLPIKFISVWGFSSDNWKRSPEEISVLMKIFEQQIEQMLPKLMNDKTRFVHLGRKERIPDSLKETIYKAEQLTKTNTKQVLSLAIDFGGQDQIVRMMHVVRDLPRDIEITEEVVGKLRDGNGEIPPADLIIRTSGEQRTSDVGWLGTNSEFYSIKKFLPDSGIDDFAQALLDFSQRERRFGGRPNGHNVVE